PPAASIRPRVSAMASTMMYVRVGSSGVRSLSFTQVPLTPPGSSKASSPSPRPDLPPEDRAVKLRRRLRRLRRYFQITDLAVGHVASNRNTGAPTASG